MPPHKHYLFVSIYQIDVAIKLSNNLTWSSYPRARLDMLSKINWIISLNQGRSFWFLNLVLASSVLLECYWVILVFLEVLLLCRASFILNSDSKYFFQQTQLVQAVNKEDYEEAARLKVAIAAAATNDTVGQVISYLDVWVHLLCHLFFLSFKFYIDGMLKLIPKFRKR